MGIGNLCLRVRRRNIAKHFFSNAILVGARMMMDKCINLVVLRVAWKIEVFGRDEFTSAGVVRKHSGRSCRGANAALEARRHAR